MTWHGDKIPNNEIWVKLGGDKGGNSFKLTFQIINIPHPNSPYNTCILLAFQAGDSYTNLKIALASYRSQITQLQTTTWRYVYIPYQKYLARSWQEICSKSMPTFGTYKNLAYLPRFLFQIYVNILYCLISGQIHARFLSRSLAKILFKILARFLDREYNYYFTLEVSRYEFLYLEITSF